MSWLSGLPYFELFALVTGLGAVVLLIRQNIWTWPVGVLYAAVSVWVFSQDKLFGQTLLHVFYVVMNLYGWWYWLYGGQRNNEDAPLAVGRLSAAGLAVGIVAGLLTTLLLGFGLRSIDGAQLAWPDAVITAFSFVAMYLQARKFIECWGLWLLINVGSVGLYLSAGLNFYAILYLVYLGLAVVGFQSWRRVLA